MSYIKSFATATCEVADNFNLEEYINTISDFIANHIDDESFNSEIRCMFEDSTLDEVSRELLEYLVVVDYKIQVNLYSEESNSNSSLWDWLCDQVRKDVMCNEVMSISHSTYDSRYGLSAGNSYYLKDGTFYCSEDIENLVKKSLSIS